MAFSEHCGELPESEGGRCQCDVNAMMYDAGAYWQNQRWHVEGEMLTAIQYHLPVKILVADNRALAFVKWEMELAGYNPNEVNLENPDFAEVAKVMGFQAETVTSPDNLEEAMRRWLKAEGPALLSFKTDTDAASFTFSKKLMESSAPGKVLSNFMAPGV